MEMLSNGTGQDAFTRSNQKTAVLTHSKTIGHINEKSYKCARKFPEIFGSRSKLKIGPTAIDILVLVLDQAAGSCAPSSSVLDNLSGWCKVVDTLLSNGDLVKNE